MGIHLKTMLWTRFLFSWILVLGLPAYISGQCCHTKIASGETYHLVSTTETVPTFCLDGCIYTKENDTKPDTNYCFKEGEGIVSCRGQDCSNSEAWIKQYFQEECSTKVNTYLGVNVEEQPIVYDYQCGPPPMIIDVAVLLFSNPTCEGDIIQNTTTRPSENGTYSTADFFLKSETPHPWSVWVIKEGYIPTCKPIPVIKPFADNIEKVQILRIDYNNKMIIPFAFISFSFTISNQLLPDVFVQGSPMTCERSFLPAPGTPQSELGKCFPTCTYSSWDTDPGKTICPCRGMIGTGLKFNSTTLPNADHPNGKGIMQGNIVAYVESQFPKSYLLYADFKRLSESTKVCESNLEITINFPVYQVTLTKKVPCFAAQNVPVTNTTGSNGGEIPTANDLEAMFSEVEGVLVWGGVDRFWIIACQLVEVDFFTSMHPAETPEFCGCISRLVLYQMDGVVTKDQIKSCYIEALQDGPMPMSSPNEGFKKFSMWQFNDFDFKTDNTLH